MNYLLVALVMILLAGGAYFLTARDTTPAEEQSVVATDTSRDAGNGNISVDAQQTLDLSNQGLTKVPDSVFSRSSIEVLDVSHNNLSGALQAEVRHLQDLRILDLSDNNFTGVPAEVGQLTKLEVLDVSNNSITGLPYEIGNLKNLQVLDLRGTDYSRQDLDVIRQGLSPNVEILVD